MFSKQKNLTILLILVAITIIIAGFSKTLNLYIHPRYSAFAIVMSLTACVFLLVDLFSTKSDAQKPAQTRATSLTILLLLLVMIVLKPAQLSANLVSNRTPLTDINNTTNQNVFDNFSGDLTRFNIKDWAIALSSSQSENVLKKQAKFIGFISELDNGNNSSRFKISRYKLTCCAVDSQPITLNANTNGVDLPKDFALGKWVEVEGVFAKNQTSEAELMLNKIDIVSEPKDPYVN